MNIRFLKRLQASKTDFPDAISTTQNIKDDIKDHLKDILNTKKGHALIDMDYGMDDLSISEVIKQRVDKHDGEKEIEIDPEKSNELEKSIRDIIVHFEPRIKKVRVYVIKNYNVNEGRVIFNVEAQLNNRQFEFETVLNETKNVKSWEA